MSDVFPGITYNPSDFKNLKEQTHQIAAGRHLVVGDVWCQKTGGWRVLLAAFGCLEGREGVSYMMDPKAISKDSLYGTLHPTTRMDNFLMAMLILKGQKT
ncbi:expressed protein [Phakopsora pachyrhizi]|uniref:Expressed protein n=1 Tax=Phakopsora pachyrhizi TaxID=170000 RepID=A0AAV0BPP4_PHAPC|nr:expressed protein [Phakopsora pachyrhizi]